MSLLLDEGRTRECVALSKELGLDLLAERVKVYWNPRMRSTAGRAFYNESQIELNPKLYEVAEAEVLPTLLHELAHLVAHARAGRRRIAPHGIEWQQACTDLGIPNAAVTHALPLPSHKQKKNWKYTCPVCGEVILRTRKIKRRYVACYPCCKKYNRGSYASKFRLQEERLA